MRQSDSIVIVWTLTLAGCLFGLALMASCTAPRRGLNWPIKTSPPVRHVWDGGMR